MVFRPTHRTTQGVQSPPVSSASRRYGGLGVIGALDQEWCELVRAHATAASVWADRYDALAACRSLDDVLRAARLNSDPVLGALLTEVSTGDRLGGRVVLQALVGRMVRMAQRDPTLERRRLPRTAVVRDQLLSAESTSGTDRGEPFDGHLASCLARASLDATRRRHVVAVV